MAPLYDNQLNIDPKVAAALGYRAPAEVHPRHAPAEAHPRHAPPARRNGAEVVGQIISWIFGSAALFVAAILVVVFLGWLHAFTITPQSGQLAASRAPGAAEAGTAHNHDTAEHSPQESQQSVPVVDKQERQPDAIPVGTAELAAGVSDPVVQVPVPRDDAQPQAPPAIETGNLETDFQQTTQASLQSESAPNSVGATAPSFQWVCIEGQLTCGYRDPDNNLVEDWVVVNGRSVPIHRMSIAKAEWVHLLPGRWGCEPSPYGMYCFERNEDTVIQQFVYDGHTIYLDMGPGLQKGETPALSQN